MADTLGVIPNNIQTAGQLAGPRRVLGIASRVLPAFKQ